MFVNNNIANNDSAYTSCGLFINIVRLCHQELTLNNLDHYIIKNVCQRQYS